MIRKFGPPGVMKVEEVEMPALADNQVRVRVRYSSVNPVDWKIRNGSLKFIYGSRFPMKLGFDIAGEVEETGRSVARFSKGDRVFGMVNYKVRGAYAEFACLDEKLLSLIPWNIDFAEAAAIPLSGLTAFQALYYKGAMEDYDSVLINGASGGVGSFAVQIAKAAGCKVTAVCGTDHFECVKALGADRVIDRLKHDFTKMPDKYDIIFDAVGKLTYFRVRRNLTEEGKYITTLPNKPADIACFLLLPILSFFGYRKSVAFISVRPGGEDLSRLALLVKEKKLVPLIERTFDLEDIAAAHAYSETGRAAGKILIKIA
ncbi:MAG: NAD(P)-dependent alcohol dehydrogenase [Acidobacteriota bacterium]